MHVCAHRSECMNLLKYSECRHINKCTMPLPMTSTKVSVNLRARNVEGWPPCELRVGICLANADRTKCYGLPYLFHASQVCLYALQPVEALKGVGSPNQTSGSWVLWCWSAHNSPSSSKWTLFPIIFCFFFDESANLQLHMPVGESSTFGGITIDYIYILFFCIFVCWIDRVKKWASSEFD